MLTSLGLEQEAVGQHIAHRHCVTVCMLLVRCKDRNVGLSLDTFLHLEQDRAEKNIMCLLLIPNLRFKLYYDYHH